MNKCRAFLIDLFKINDEFAGVVFGIRQNLRAEEGDDVVGDDNTLLVLEVRVVDAKVRVEPVYFAGDELSRDESL